MSRTGSDLNSGNACWETPPAVFAKLQEDFGPFDLDLTANASNHLRPRWLGPGSDIGEDALTIPWHYYGDAGFSNPPYGPFVQKILRKAADEARLGFTTTLLLPMRVTKAFREVILPQASRLLFCSKRITFYENGASRINPKTGKPDPAMFDSIIVQFEPPPHYDDHLIVNEWKVPDHG